MDAIGIVELNSIAAGIEAGDEMLKTANVKLVTAQPVCPGKYVIVVQGMVANVRSSVDSGVAKAEEALVDSLVIANIHPEVFGALSCTNEIEKRNAIGVVETFSLVTSIYAADTAVKTADVSLMEIRLGRGLGGKSYVILTGDVSSVKYAVEAASNNENTQGMIVRTAVIPSIHEDLMKALL